MVKLVRAVLTFLIIFLGAVTVLFIDFAYKTFSYRQSDVKSDAIVVLAGGRGRITEGVRLFRQGRGSHLLLIGVDPSVRRHELYRPRSGDPPAEQVILEKVSRNTLENAIYCKELLTRIQAGSILLITSRYHMKRSTLLFRSVLQKNVAIHPYPVDSANLKEIWWRDRSSIRLLFSEFYKYCMYRLFFLFSPGELRPGIHVGPENI